MIDATGVKSRYHAGAGRRWRVMSLNPPLVLLPMIQLLHAFRSVPRIAFFGDRAYAAMARRIETLTHMRRRSRWRRFLRSIPICRIIPLPTGRFIMTKMTVQTEGSCFRIIVNPGPVIRSTAASVLR
jgi:hypothetical protein